jgi:pimeloyl-ACP methyl ester carboxylesterase
MEDRGDNIESRGMSAIGHVTSADGVRIAYRDDGPKDRPAILFCTMGTAALGVWDPVAETLAADWRLILHDRRGDGDSDAGPPASHSFETYVSDALLVLDRAGCAKAVICGMAFGARVALHLARDAPERTAGLILFDATGGPAASEAERKAGHDEAARLRAEAGLPKVQVDRSWFYRRDPAGAGLNRLALRDQPPWMPGLGEIGVRTFIACGEQDPNLPGSHRLAREIPGASFMPMPMTGHASILDRPDLIASLMRDFLSAIAQPTEA